MAPQQSEGLYRQARDGARQRAETAQVLEEAEKSSDLDQVKLDTSKEVRQVQPAWGGGGMAGPTYQAQPADARSGPEIHAERESGMQMPMSKNVYS